MRRTLYCTTVGFVLSVMACKSDKQEVVSGPVTDTLVVSKPPEIIGKDEPETNYEKQKTKSKTSTQANSNRQAKPPADPADKDAVVEDPYAITQQDMEYNEFPAKKAEYPGGVAALNKYLAEHIRYPAQAREHKIEGTVYANILVDESGKLGDVSFPHPLGYGLEEEVLKAIKGMPNLIPAEDQGVAVKTKFYLPVKFYMK